jgi:outer membrane protein assembly factor BamB
MYHHDLTHTGYSTSTAPNTNQTLWNYTTGNSVYSSPAVSGGRVYVGSWDKKVYALNATTGAFIWSYTTGGTPPYAGVSSSPAVVGGRVYVGSLDKKVYCLNATTGVRIWNYTTGNSVYSSPAVSGGRVYVGSLDKKVYALNATTGAFIWSYTTGGTPPYAGVSSSPAVADGRVYVGSWDKKVYALNATTGAFIWSYTTGDVVMCDPAVVGGRVYVGSDDNKTYALNATTGAFIWSYTTGNLVDSSPAVADGKVFVGSDDYKVYALNATTGARIWNYTTGYQVSSSPAVADGKVFVGSLDHKVYALNATTGARIWSYTTSGEVGSSPAVVGGRVYVGSADHKVYVFGLALSVSISPSSVHMDVGQSKTFTSSVSGGASPYSYQWYLDSTPVSGATSASWAFTPLSSGSYTVYLKVTDAMNAVATSNTVPVTVNAALSVTISPGSAAFDIGQSQLFTSSVSGGTSPFTYQWCLNGVAVSGATSSTWNFTPSSSGSYNVYLNVTDSVSFVAKSNVAPVTVNPAPSITISPASVTMDVGQSQLFSSSVSGGTSPYSYQWYLNSAPVSNATNPTWTFTPTSAGLYTVYAKVTDHVGVQATSNTVPVTVNGRLSVSVSPTSTTLDVGQSQLFTSTVSGGTSPFTYQWCLNGVAVSGATSSTWNFTPSSSGSYNVYLNVTDSVSFVAKSNVAPVTVNGALSVTISPANVTMDVGQSQLFSSSVSGGTSPYSYQWYLDGNPVSGATSSTWTFSPVSTGSYTVYVVVTDSASTPVSVQSNVASVTVNRALSVSNSPTSVVMDIGQSQLFSSSVSGGTSPYSYQWYLDDNPVSGATSATWTYTPSTSGWHHVYVQVTDNASTPVTTQSNTALVAVNSALSVSITPTSVVMDVGQSQVFTSDVSNGTFPYSYQWYRNGLPVSGATGANWTFTPSSSGSYTVYVRVTDAVSFVATSNTAYVTVNGALSVTISPTSVTIGVGQSQLFTSSVSGGTSPYSYQWYLNSTPVSGANSSSWTFTSTSEGSYTIYVKVTDGVGMQATSNIATVTVLTHDVAVTNVTSSKTIVGQGFNANISVTVANQGGFAETFKVTMYANATSIASENITLSGGNLVTITFTWNTSGFAKGNYTISAYAWPVPGEKEIDKADNNCTDGWIVVTWQGDLTDKDHLTPPGGVSDGKVDENDLWYFCSAFIDYYKIHRLDANCDFNNDGKIDEDDLWTFCGAFIAYWKVHH